MTTAIPITLFYLLSIAPSAFAAEPVRVPWSRLAPLVTGATVSIEFTTNRKSLQGRVEKVQPDSIQLNTPTGSTSVPRAGLSRIRVRRQSRKPAFIAIGAAGGAALFALLAHPPQPLFKDGGLYACNGPGPCAKLDTDPHPNYALAAAAGAGVGAFAGWLAGRRTTTRDMIIEISPDPQPGLRNPDTP